MVLDGRCCCRTEFFEKVRGYELGRDYQVGALRAVTATLLGGKTIHHALGLNPFLARKEGSELEPKHDVAKRALMWLTSLCRRGIRGAASRGVTCKRGAFRAAAGAFRVARVASWASVRVFHRILWPEGLVGVSGGAFRCASHIPPTLFLD